MNQQQLQLLYSLLKEAQSVLPDASTFKVEVEKGKYRLVGESSYINNGAIETYTEGTEGVIEKKVWTMY